MLTPMHRNIYNMTKLHILTHLDIPLTDAECWERYPKHRWVFQSARLLDIQHIDWSLTKTDEFSYKIANFIIDLPDYDPGSLFVKHQTGTNVNSIVYLIRGEIKHISHQSADNSELEGSTELRINAFISLYFQRFTGIISFVSNNTNITAIKLCPTDTYLNSIKDTNQLKLIHRIYKKK